MRRGRRQEFAQAYAEAGGEIPDPLAEETFRSAVLDWDARARPAGRKRLALVRDLLTTRRRELAPRLAGAQFGAARCDDCLLTAHWRLGDGRTLMLLANLSAASAERPGLLRSGQPIWGGELQQRLPPWSVFWTIGDR